MRPPASLRRRHGGGWFGNRSSWTHREASPQEKAEALDGFWMGFELTNGAAFEFTPDVRALLALAPEGWQGLYALRTSLLDEALAELRALQAATGDPAERQEMAGALAVFEELQRALAKHDAGTDLVVLRSRPDGALIRGIW